MKNRIKIMMLVCFIVLSCASEIQIVEADVPLAVLTAFKLKYAQATEVQWEIEKEDGRLIYEAGFKQGGKKKEASFKPDGTWVEEE